MAFALLDDGATARHVSSHDASQPPSNSHSHESQSEQVYVAVVNDNDMTSTPNVSIDPAPSPSPTSDVTTSLLQSPPNTYIHQSDVEDDDGSEPGLIMEGKRTNIPIANATILGSIFNLGNTIVGVGILSIPSTFYAFGIILGPIILAITGCFTAFALHLLTCCAIKMGHPQPNFFLLSKATFPAARYLVDAAIAIKSIGVSSSYLLVVGQLMVPAVMGSKDPSEFSDYVIDRRFWISLAMFVTIPLSCLPRMTHMRFTSALSVLTCLYLLLVLIYEYGSGSEPTVRPDKVVEYVRFEVTSITSIPTMVFAFTCAQNIFTIYSELKIKSMQNMNRIINSTIIGVFGLYLLVGLLGYLSFGQHTTSDFLVDYTNNTTLVNICRVCMALHVCTCYPLSCHPFRVCITSSLYELFPRLRNSGSSHMPAILHLIITTFFIGITYTIAMTTDSLQLLFSIIGATASTLITFILPGIFYVRLTIHDSARYHWKRVLAFCLTCLGCILLVMSLVIIILQNATNVFAGGASASD